MLETEKKLLCALTSATDGTEDKEIHCFKEGQPCEAGLNMLKEQIELSNGNEANPFILVEDIDDAAPPETIIDENEEGIATLT